MALYGVSLACSSEVLKGNESSMEKDDEKENSGRPRRRAFHKASENLSHYNKYNLKSKKIQPPKEALPRLVVKLEKLSSERLSKLMPPPAKQPSTRTRKKQGSEVKVKKEPKRAKKKAENTTSMEVEDPEALCTTPIDTIALNSSDEDKENVVVKRKASRKAKIVKVKKGLQRSKRTRSQMKNTEPNSKRSKLSTVEEENPIGSSEETSTELLHNIESRKLKSASGQLTKSVVEESVKILPQPMILLTDILTEISNHTITTNETHTFTEGSNEVKKTVVLNKRTYKINTSRGDTITNRTVKIFNRMCNKTVTVNKKTAKDTVVAPQVREESVDTLTDHVASVEGEKTQSARVTRMKTRNWAKVQEESGAKENEKDDSRKEPASLKLNAATSNKKRPLVATTSKNKTSSSSTSKVNGIPSSSKLHPAKAQLALKLSHNGLEEEDAARKKEVLLQVQTQERHRKLQEKKLKAQQQRQVFLIKMHQALEQKRLKDEAEQEKVLQQRLEEQAERKRQAAKEREREEERKRQEERKFEDERKQLKEEERVHVNQHGLSSKKSISFAKKTPLVPSYDCYDSDDPCRPKYRAQKPNWVSREEKRSTLMSMQMIESKLLSTLFYVKAQTMDLCDVFEQITPHKLRRNSSVIWEHKPRFTRMPGFAEADVSTISETP